MERPWLYFCCSGRKKVPPCLDSTRYVAAIPLDGAGLLLLVKMHLGEILVHWFGQQVANIVSLTDLLADIG